jgi:aryl-alcohol dehydrogenase-like predicted oxidoreductase
MTSGLPVRTLGRTGLEVTHLGYGALELRGMTDQAGVLERAITDGQAETILNAVLDSGINYIDTASRYGASEEYIGKCISHRRSEYVLATKCTREATAEGRNVWTTENMFRNIEQSLKRMKTDYVDVLQLHNPMPKDAESVDLVGTLEEIRRQGKARWIGISTNLPYMSTFAAIDAFDVYQTNYSTLQPEHFDWITKLTEDGRGTIIRTRAAKGEPDIPGSPAHSRGVQFATDEERWVSFESVGLDELREEGESRTAFVLRYTFAHPDISTVIVGTLDPEHLEENVRTLENGPLAPDLVAEVDRRLEPLGFRPAPLT